MKSVLEPNAVIVSLFKQKLGLKRHQSAPLLPEREYYLSHLLHQGTSPDRARVIAGMLLNVVKHLKLENLRDVGKEEIRNASRSWVLHQGIHAKASVGGVSAAFNLTATNWLRFHEKLLISPSPPLPFGAILPDFKQFMSGPRAMTSATVRGYASRAHLFLRWASSRHSSFASITLGDVEDYFVSLRLGGMKPRSIASVSQTLRTLFRFTEQKQWSRPLISAGISSPSVPRYDPEPKGPRWSDVRRMLEAEITSPHDVRGSAVLFLFAIYGLRSVEVSSLMLGDFDWREKTFTVRRAKGGRIQRFPIQEEVGDALIRYLKTGRPVCTCRHFFVTIKPPFRPMSHASLRCIVASRMKRLNISSPVYSTHSLRHSCATELLHRGSSMFEIADFLGHWNTRSVGIYAKSSAASIREVSNFRLMELT